MCRLEDKNLGDFASQLDAAAAESWAGKGMPQEEGFS